MQHRKHLKVGISLKSSQLAAPAYEKVKILYVFALIKQTLCQRELIILLWCDAKPDSKTTVSHSTHLSKSSTNPLYLYFGDCSEGFDLKPIPG